MPRWSAATSSLKPVKPFWTERCRVRSTLSAAHYSMSDPASVLDLQRFNSRLDAIDPITEFGVVEKVVGNTIESHGPNVTMGCVCWLENQGRRIPVEVVGFTHDKIIAMPLG